MQIDTDTFWLAAVVLLGALMAATMALAIAAARVRAAARRVHEQQTQHEGMSNRLLENEYRLRAIIESEPECMKLQAANGTVLEINPAGLALLEADSPGDVIGKPIYLFVAAESRDVYRDNVRRVFAGESVVYEFRLITLKGSSRWMETHATPLRDAHGAIYALLAITRDITDRRLVEERARRHQSELAHVARLSTMGEMATALAHELNQPLSAIAAFARGCTRRVRAGTTTLAELNEPLDAISEQAERAGAMIRHLREFVRKRELERVAIDINLVVRSVAQFAEIEARQHATRLRLELAGGLAPAHADPIMVEQVIGNLVRNAIDAMDEAHSPCREITVRTARADGAAIGVEVSDTGPGIMAGLVEQVFDPFFTTKPDGVGMGLSISRSIVESHGGRIGVRSRPGGGATFGFTLPVFSQEVTRDALAHGVRR
ncbi:MAG: PAS domain S-box protein [Ideonella sp.]|nr:PAS domain S-box protein [Ideonella sp.]MCC7458301.1 PAS domain S-box protein [Nitrospira sp.]